MFMAIMGDLGIIAIFEYVRNVFFEDSSDEDDILEKVDNYAENTVPMTDRQFQMHFRMSPDTFEDLLRKMNATRLEMHNNVIISSGYPRTTLEKEAMILIWCLGNMESFRSVADRFGISKSTCWDILHRTCNLLLQLNRKFNVIDWPSRERQMEISENFQNNNGFPGIIGAIDGSHIRITAPKENHNSYINRKNFYSVLLQGVCDHRLLFTDVYAGEAGSIHDYTLYKRSDLYHNMRNHQVVYYDDTYLIGDLAYKLSTKLIVGFKDNGHLTFQQRNFNNILNKKRVKIENAFALLKGRFRRLKFIENRRLDLIAQLIICACILHNICILHGDFLEDINIEEEAAHENLFNPRNVPDIEDEVEDRNAIIKRQNLLNALPVIRQ